jgi:seryl-tRNA synthetase
LGDKAKEAGARASELESQLGEKQEALRSLLLLVPNIPWDGAPVGPDDSANQVVRRSASRPSSISSRSTMSR